MDGADMGEEWPRIPNPHTGVRHSGGTGASLPPNGAVVMASVEADLGEGMYSLRWGGNRIAVSSRAKLTPGQSLILKSETSPEGKPTLVVQGPALPERGHAQTGAAYAPPVQRDAGATGGMAIGAATPPVPAGPPQPSSSLLGAVLEMVPELEQGMERLLAAAEETRAHAGARRVHLPEKRETASPPAPQTAEMEKTRQERQASVSPQQADPSRQSGTPPSAPAVPNAAPATAARPEPAPPPELEPAPTLPVSVGKDGAGQPPPASIRSASGQTPGTSRPDGVSHEVSLPSSPAASAGPTATDGTPPPAAQSPAHAQTPSTSQAPTQTPAPVADGDAVSQAYVKEALTQMVKAAALPLVSPESDSLSLGVRPAKVPEAIADKAAGLLLRAAGLTPGPATLEAGKALLENNVPIDRPTVQALLALAAGVEGSEREAVLNAAARLSAKDIPVAMPLASGMADVIARTDSVSRLVENAAAALADAAVPGVKPMVDAARDMLNLLAIDLDAPEAPRALERFISTFGRETLGKALALVEASAQTVLESHPVLPRIDQALAVILGTLETAAKQEHAASAPVPSPQAPPEPAGATPPPVPPPPADTPARESAPLPLAETPDGPPPAALRPEQVRPPFPAPSPDAPPPTVSDAPAVPGAPAVPAVSGEAPISDFVSPPPAAPPAVVQPAAATPDQGRTADSPVVPDAPSIPPAKNGPEQVPPPRHDMPLPGAEQAVRDAAAVLPAPSPESGIPWRNAAEALVVAPANPPRVSAGVDALSILSALSPETDAHNGALPSMPPPPTPTPVPQPVRPSLPQPTPPGGGGETGAPNAPATGQAPAREAGAVLDTLNQSRESGLDLGQSKEAALNSGGKTAEHRDAQGLTKTDPFFQTPGVNRPEIEILKPSGYLDRYLRGDDDVSAKTKADAASLVKDLLSGDRERAAGAMRELPTKDAAVLRETAARLSRMEAEIMRGEPVLNRLSDAASSLRDLGRQLLAVKAENLAGQERNPGVMLAEVPFKLSDNAGDGRMQMFYRKSGAKGEGWSARVILDLNTTGMGPVLGDLRFFGSDMNLTMFAERQSAADFLSAVAAELADGLRKKGFRLKSRFLALPPPPPPPSIRAERPAIAGETDSPSADGAERGAVRRGRLDTKA